MQPTASSREEDADSEATFGEEISEQEREGGIKALGKKMRPGIRKSVPIGQNDTRHQVVLAFLKLQRSRQPSETREGLSLQVARCFGRGRCFARKIVTWERAWIKERNIPEGRKGCYTKVQSWLDEFNLLLENGWRGQRMLVGSFQTPDVIGSCSG